ncbi:TIGR00153 family protein [Candidatus Poribacteria bacterium]|nr:TIGR00153 family protein [Candidatus Poribacteria bacterium]
MRIKGTEKKVIGLIEEHVDKVELCLQSMLKSLNSYLQNKMDLAESHAEETHKAESEADGIRRSISDLLHQGAFLPVFRVDVMELVNIIDEIAGQAQNCCKMITAQRPDIPDELIDDFRNIAEESVSIIKPLQEGVLNMSRDFSIIRDKTGEVHRIEQSVDVLEAKLSRKIFSKDLELARKIHLNHLVDVIAEITDVAEDAAEILETLVVKKQT